MCNNLAFELRSQHSHHTTLLNTQNKTRHGKEEENTSKTNLYLQLQN